MRRNSANGQSIERELRLGYQWQGVGAAVIHHSRAMSDVFTFTLTPASSATVTVTVSVVDTNYTDTAGGACCQSVMTQTVTCEDRGGKPGRSANSNDVMVHQSSITIYPNPTNNMVTITSAKDEINSVQVIDVNGKKVGEYSYKHAKTANITLDKLPPGVYLFRVNNEVSKTVSKKE